MSRAARPSRMRALYGGREKILWEFVIPRVTFCLCILVHFEQTWRERGAEVITGRLCGRKEAEFFIAVRLIKFSCRDFVQTYRDVAK